MPILSKSQAHPASFAVWSLSDGTSSLPRLQLGRQKNHHTQSLILAGRSNRYFQAFEEGNMVNRARRNYGASFLVLSLIVSPAAFAAAESSAQDKPQAEAEAKSYLPPWMQGKSGSDNASAPATAVTPDNNATQGSKTVAAGDDETPKRKVRGASQGHRSHRHSSQGGPIFGGFAGLFGN